MLTTIGWLAGGLPLTGSAQEPSTFCRVACGVPSFDELAEVPANSDNALLQAASGFRCTFDDMTDIVIEDVSYTNEFGIGALRGTARVGGNLRFVAVDVFLHSLSPMSTSFIEVTPSGNVNVITVYEAQDADSGFVAAYSRHTNVPALRKGSCLPTRLGADRPIPED